MTTISVFFFSFPLLDSFLWFFIFFSLLFLQQQLPVYCQMVDDKQKNIKEVFEIRDTNANSDDDDDDGSGNENDQDNNH